jgi:hypothetical protein
MESRSICTYARRAAVLSIWCLLVILLSKMATRCVTLFTKGISCPFSCSTSSGIRSLLERYDRVSFPFIDPCVPAPTPRLHLQWVRGAVCREHDVRVSMSRKYWISSSNRTKWVPDASGDIIYVQTVQYWGKGGTLRHPCHYFSWRRIFAFYWD